MSWFKTIYESVINEISADDAYVRFYSSIPREDYDAILGGDPAPNKFMQFFLNCVRDGYSDKEEAIQAIQAYKSADNLIRQNVKNKVDAGEYADAADVIGDIEYLSNGGAIVSKKKFAKEGYIKIKEDERWLVTSTTNYLASNHYFRTSHWCTASDREGRYDGYKMFLRYGEYSDSVLIQFKWKGKIEEDERPESLDEDADSRLWDTEKGFIGEEMPKQYSMFQVQVSVEPMGTIGQICDFLDESVGTETLKSYIGTELFSVLKDREILTWLKKRVDEQAQKERVYQDKMDAIIEKRKERMQEKYRKEEERLQKIADAFNEEKHQAVAEKWREFCEKKMYENPEIISLIYGRDCDRSEDATDDMLAQTNYVGVNSAIPLDGGRYMLDLICKIGTQRYVADDTNARGYSVPILAEYVSIDRARGTGNLIVFVDENGRLLDGTLGPFNTTYSDIEYVRRLDGEWEKRFFIIEIENDTNSENYTGPHWTLYDDKTKKTMPIQHRLSRYCKINDETTIFFGRIRHIMGEDIYFYNENTGEFRLRGEKDPCCHLVSRDEGLVLYRQNEDFQLLYYPDQEIYGFKIPRSTDYMASQYKSFEGTLLHYVQTCDYSNVIRLVFENGEHNGILKDGGDLLFAKNGYDSSIKLDGRFLLWVDAHGESELLQYAEGKYAKLDKDTETWNPCDRFGKTEKEKIAAKNFADWQAQGGHSPEAKAQMDKMWADRNGENINPLDAWDDNDAMIGNDSKVADGVTYDDNFAYSKAMQKFDKDDNWRGYIGFKDPEGQYKNLNRALQDPDYGMTKLINGEIPDYIRRNPWYRIGKNGKPLDQPWYDEDEIPARLSDRVVREEKINESINKMRSIWDRMGLND